MNPLPQNLPRFLPTLTEVVDPASLGLNVAPLQPALDELVRTVMQSVQVELERCVREQVQARMPEYLQTVQACVREEIEPLARRLVSEALARLEAQETTK
jgi:hypothetical protein